MPRIAHYKLKPHFIEYLIIYGTQLDTKPETRWIGEILQRADLTGTAKMDRIDDYELQTI